MDGNGALSLLRELDIAVVDDDHSILEIVGAYLESKGHQVAVFETGEQGLEAVNSREYDLVVSDVHMAGVNGFELLKATRARYPDIGFVLMTAYEERYPISHALGAGADGYISKPFNLNRFSLIFDRAYWSALSREDWWDQRAVTDKESSGASRD